MDVDLSTDLRGLLPLVAPLLSGHSDLAIGTRLAHGARVVRGPKREVISRAYNGLLRTVLRARFSDAQCGFKAARADLLDGAAPRGPRRRLVLRHGAARGRPAARAADPRGPGRLDRRSRLARADRAHRRRRPARRGAADGELPARPLRGGRRGQHDRARAALPRAPRRFGPRRRERGRARVDRDRQHRGQPPLHVPRARACRAAAPSPARRARVLLDAGTDQLRAARAARAVRGAAAGGRARRARRGQPHRHGHPLRRHAHMGLRPAPPHRLTPLVTPDRRTA